MMKHTIVKFHRHAFFRLALSATAVLVAAACSSNVPAAAQTADSSPPPAAGSGPEARKPDPQAAWAAATRRMTEDEGEAAKALESQLARINAFFAERKQGARPFAAAVLSTEGKLQATSALVEGAASALGELFGNKPSRGPDSFALYARRAFRQHVLDTEQLEKVINAAVAGYGAEVQRLDAKQLVDLRADLDDAGLDLAGALPEIRAGNMVAGHGHVIVSQAIDACANDYCASIVKFAVSMVIGNAISDRFTQDDDSNARKLAINLGVGAGVDKALDETLARAGYDPEGELAAKVTASLERMRVRLVDGDPQAVKAYDYMRSWQWTWPDTDVATACNRASDAIERSGELGLRRSLQAMYDRRAEARRRAFLRFIFGPPAAPRTRTALKVPQGDQVVKYAQTCEAFWKGKRP